MDGQGGEVKEELGSSRKPDKRIRQNDSVFSDSDDVTSGLHWCEWNGIICHICILSMFPLQDI